MELRGSSMQVSQRTRNFYALYSLGYDMHVIIIVFNK